MNEPSGLRVIGCPQCGAPAEVRGEGTLESTGGPVEIVRVRCAERHWFLMAEDQLPRSARTAPAEPVRASGRADRPA